MNVKLIYRFFVIVPLLLIEINAGAQELPQNYFRNPLDMPIGLSATFAEFRTGHFHAGLDMRTGGAVDKPVYAAADGYVAKVSISPWGGGKILYIKHPNGYTSVYMHLNGYAGEIGKAVLREQYAQQKYNIVKLFSPDELPVKKGQVVAYSGNTGGSGGPHLHFEIRRGGAEDLHTHSTTINPLRFGLPYVDNIKPVIRGVRLYPVGGTPFEAPADGKVVVNGPFYLGIYATDAAAGSTAKNGVDRVEVYLDGDLAFMYTTVELPIDSSRMDNALIDYKLYSSTRQAYLLTRALPGAEGPWIPVRMGDGVFRFEPGTTHRVDIKVFDIKNNSALRSLTVSMADAETVIPEKKYAGEAAKFDQPFIIKHPAVSINMPAYTLYDDDFMRVSCQGQTVKVAPTVNDIPPNLYYTMGIRGSLPGVPSDKVVVAHVTRKPGSVKLSAYKTTFSGGLYTAQVRDWGEFTLAADTTAPTVRPVNFSEGKPFKGSLLKVKIGDNLAGIETYNCYLNGSWILAEYDGKTATLFIDTAGKMKAGANVLAVEVSDGAGNCKRISFTINR